MILHYRIAFIFLTHDKKYLVNILTTKKLYLGRFSTLL